MLKEAWEKFLDWLASDGSEDNSKRI